MSLLESKTKENTQVMEEKRTKWKKPKKWQIVVIVAIVVAALLAGMTLTRGSGRKNQGQATYKTDVATIRSITDTISDSGALEPADSYTVISLVSGEILSAGFNTGDVVTKDDILYLVDSSDTANSIERAENSLNRSRRNYNDIIDSQNDLTVKAPISGKITGITASVGDMINNNAPIATIENTSKLILTEYYSDEYADEIYVGMPATVAISSQMMTLTGKVKEINGLTRISETGVSCFAVIVEVENPGALSVGDTATCWLDGNIYPTITDNDGLEASMRKTIYSGVSGEVSKLNVRNNETVSEGQTVMVLTSDTLDDNIQDASDSLRDAELSLENQYDILDNYTIRAPISGTIVDKYYKEGENAETGKTLCTIFDLSSLNITLNVDELDIKTLAVGQKATITADAVPDTTYEGIITEIGINGTAENGVTTYPVTVRIDDTDGLLPGMNVDISIIISEKLDILTIPAGAVQNGNRVLVKTKDGTTGEGAPEGYKYVTVEIGVSDEDFVEILSGLMEGDEIAYMPETASNEMPFGPMGGMPMGGMPMGNMPSGGGMQGGGLFLQIAD